MSGPAPDMHAPENRFYQICRPEISSRAGSQQCAASLMTNMFFIFYILPINLFKYGRTATSLHLDWWLSLCHYDHPVLMSSCNVAQTKLKTEEGSMKEGPLDEPAHKPASVSVRVQQHKKGLVFFPRKL